MAQSSIQEPDCRLPLPNHSYRVLVAHMIPSQPDSNLVNAHSILSHVYIDTETRSPQIPRSKCSPSQVQAVSNPNSLKSTPSRNHAAPTLFSPRCPDYCVSTPDHLNFYTKLLLAMISKRYRYHLKVNHVQDYSTVAIESTTDNSPTILLHMIARYGLTTIALTTTSM